MKKRSKIATTALATLLGLCCGCSDGTAAAEADPGVGEELVDLYDDTSNFVDLKRHELIAALEERQEEFAALQRELDERAENLEEDASAEWQRQRERIEDLRATLAAGIVDLKTSSEESWTELREELVEVTTELRRELAAASLSKEG